MSYMRSIRTAAVYARHPKRGKLQNMETKTPFTSYFQAYKVAYALAYIYIQLYIAKELRIKNILVDDYKPLVVK